MHIKKTIKAIDKKDLEDLIQEEIEVYGPTCSLNHIDVSNITDMLEIFSGLKSKFNGDISQWNTSNVINMRSMFHDSEFNGDISKWNTSNVIDMNSMFSKSEFNGDISQWNTSKVTDMGGMFSQSTFNGDISQ